MGWLEIWILVISMCTSHRIVTNWSLDAFSRIRHAFLLRTNLFSWTGDDISCKRTTHSTVDLLANEPLLASNPRIFSVLNRCTLHGGTWHVLGWSHDVVPDISRMNNKFSSLLCYTGLSSPISWTHKKSAYMLPHPYIVCCVGGDGIGYCTCSCCAAILMQQQKNNVLTLYCIINPSSTKIDGKQQ